MRRILPVLFLTSITGIAFGQAAPPPVVEPPPEPPPAEPPPAEPPPADAPPADAPPADAPPPAEPPPAEPPPAEPPPTVPPPSVPPPPGPPAWSFGQSATPQADSGARPTQPPSSTPKAQKLPFRLSTFGWDHSATSETVGIGRETQTRNPTYEMSFVLQPRYYVWEADDPTQAISIRGRLDLIREMTNSDTTTREGEWTFSDLSIFPQYGVNVYADGDVSTDLGVRLPTLAFPTSKVSANSGRVIQVGTMLLGSQKMPVLGSGAEVLETFTLTLRGAYSHWFTEATQPTNDDLARVRMGPDGRSLPGDQLGGAAHAKHNVTLDLIGELAIHERVKWTNWFQWGIAYKYELQREQPACNVLTGCATPDVVDDPTDYAVTTLFNTEIAIDILDEFELDLGYANLTSQVGPDGQRRNIFYSPDARVYTTFVAKLDELYLTATGARQSAKAPAAPRRLARKAQSARTP